jgi:hypothetical protein
MNAKNLSESRKIFIRRDKARIRRDVFDIREKRKLISGLYPSVH